MIGVDKAASIIGNIATASNEQASGIAQINKGIEQVAQVVQNNSATAEESAAASEQLSSQAELLKEMTSQFKLRKGTKSLTTGLAAHDTKKTKSHSEAVKNPQILLGDHEFDKY